LFPDKVTGNDNQNDTRIVENERSVVNQQPASNRERADKYGDNLLSAQVPLSKVFCYTRLIHLNGL
jgi:hypothetical protein